MHTVSSLVRTASRQGRGARRETEREEGNDLRGNKGMHNLISLLIHLKAGSRSSAAAY